MPSSIEVINGHKYLVDRDEVGNVKKLEARDDVVTPSYPVIRPAEKLVLVALVQKDPATWALPDVARALQLLLKGLARQLREGDV